MSKTANVANIKSWVFSAACEDKLNIRYSEIFRGEDW
jgi:hypothetical protein